MPASWNERCSEFIRKDKKETEKKYNIRFGQTEIYCARCGKSCWPGTHVCWDIQLEKLREARRISKEDSEPLIEKIKLMGRSKVATLLELNKGTVSHWINRINIPADYRDKIRSL